MLRALWHEREQQKQRIDDLYLENLQLQKEMLRYKKATYGPRADRLSENELAQALLEFAEELEQKPLPAEDLPQGEAEPEVRRVQRRKGRRALANFENLPVSTHVYELPAEQRRCSCCGEQRQEIGSEESWQIEYFPGHFERLRHVRKKYACASCERAGENPQIEAAAKAETAIEKGFAGPGLLAYIVTSKFADYLPLYSAGRYLRAPRLCNFPRHAIGVVRGCRGPGGATVPADGGTGKAVPCGGHRRHGLSDAAAGADAIRAHVGVRR